MNGTRGVGSDELSDDEAGQDRLAELEARLQQLEAGGLKARGRNLARRVMPPEAARHFRNAGREQLLGIRAIVDFWLERLDRADERAEAHERRTETIELE